MILKMFILDSNAFAILCNLQTKLGSLQSLNEAPDSDPAVLHIVLYLRAIREPVTVG